MPKTRGGHYEGFVLPFGDAILTGYVVGSVPDKPEEVREGLRPHPVLQPYFFVPQYNEAVPGLWKTDGDGLSVTLGSRPYFVTVVLKGVTKW